jgi:hypothetical protein
MDDFPVAIAEADQRTQRDDRGLRELVVRISQDYVVELMRSEKFRSALEKTVGFAADLALSLFRKMSSMKDQQKYHCSQCPRCLSLVLPFCFLVDDVKYHWLAATPFSTLE